MIPYAVFAFILFNLSYIISASSLYNPDDPLWELDATNFHRIVLGKSNAWIIEFYNSWCGHCIRFAPTWVEFSKDIKTWRNVIDVAVVNCAQSENVKLCRNYSIESFPTIRFFWTYVNESDKGEPLNGPRGIAALEKATIHFLESQWENGVPSGWPSFKPIETSNLQNIIDIIPENENSIYLFVENQTSLIGRKIILDLSFQKKLIIRRILSTNAELLSKLTIEDVNSSLPLLLKMKRDGNIELLLRFSRQTNSSYIRDQVFELLIGQPRSNNDEEKEGDNNESNKINTPDAVYMADLENAVHYSLRQEIGIHKMISGPKLLALKSYLSALKMYFPGRPSVNGYLAKLYNFVSHRKNSITGESFLQAMDELQDEKEFLPEMQEWVGCKGSSSKYRGYPCSLWTLFHTLTVQAYNMYEDYQGRLKEDPHKILWTIRNYVKYFFTCEECSRNFQTMAANLENEVKTPRDIVLWLWNAHNRVNRRLAGDITEDPEHPKMQFPSKERCRRCRISNNNGDDDIKWDKAIVLHYLQHFYGKDNIKKESNIIDQDSLESEKMKLENMPMGKGHILLPVMNLLEALLYSSFILHI